MKILILLLPQKFLSRMSLPVVNYTICRTCLSESESMMCIYNTQEFEQLGTRICDLIRLCASVQVYKGDGLPEQICMRCIGELKRVILFKKLCEKSDATLRNLLVPSHNDQLNVKLEPEVVIKTEFIDSTANQEAENHIDTKVYVDEISCHDFHSNPTSHDTKYICEPKHEDNASIEVEDNVSDDKHRGCINELPSESFKCHLCDKSFDTNSTLDNHICKNSASADNLEQSASPALPPHTCAICNKTFRGNSYLERHMITHMSEKPFVCYLCGKGFTSEHYLKHHILGHTGGRKQHTCDICGKGFYSITNLKTHQQIHTGEKPFLCSVCGKSFAQNMQLQLHLLTHTGDKPHECDVCDKKYSQASALKDHKRTHTGEKPYQCLVCGKCFNSASVLWKHRWTHTGEKSKECEVCHKFFRSSGQLKIHMRGHTGEKPHSCEVCGKSFFTNGLVKTHMRVHTGERPFICELCGYAFTQSGALATHKKLVHKPKDLVA